MKTEMTYNERADKDRRKAVAEGLRSIARDEKIIKQGRERLEGAVVDIVNAMRRQGEQLQMICGHAQVNFQFVKDLAAGPKLRLPWGDGSNSKENLQYVFEMARSRVSVTCRVPKEIAAWSDVAVEARRTVLCQMELLQVGSRGLIEDGQAPPPADPLVHIFDDLGRMKHNFMKCVRLEPWEDRSRQQIEDFLSDTEWIAEERAKAKGFLEKTKG